MMHVRPGAAAIEDHELQKTTKTRTPPPAQRQTLHSRSQPTLLSNCSKASQEMNTSSTAAAAKPRASHELLHSSSYDDEERAPSTSTGYCCCSCWLKYTTSNSLSNKQQQTTNKQIQLQQIHLLQLQEEIMLLRIMDRPIHGSIDPVDDDKHL
ncbi:unnamed protein product [Sphagnum jensenii]|uniref:Uncharacterized protein n=1 Tax=Sphagnum jensenii TaxID=128206 RepID=A0ABP0VZV7_9BRYO